MLQQSSPQDAIFAQKNLSMTRVKGELIVQDPQEWQFQLPPDAYMVRGRDSKPTFITYMGSQPPQPLGRSLP